MTDDRPSMSGRCQNCESCTHQGTKGKRGVVLFGSGHWSIPCRLSAVLVSLLVLFVNALPAGEWRLPANEDDPPIYGIKGGLAFAIPPGGFRGPGGGPRGLIRIGYPILPDGGYDLVNFIAVEPIVAGKKGFSELERSRLDRVPGKRLWVDPADWPKPKLVQTADGAESIELAVHVETFDNGAAVRLVLAQQSDRPDELVLSVFPEPGSAAIEYCILTATMGNMARARRLWLRDETVSSLALYPDYKGNGFAPHRVYPLERLRRTQAGDVFVAITTDETDPAAVFPFPGSRIWYYGGFPVRSRKEITAPNWDCKKTCADALRRAWALSELWHGFERSTKAFRAILTSGRGDGGRQ